MTNMWFLIYIPTGHFKRFTIIVYRDTRAIFKKWPESIYNQPKITM